MNTLDKILKARSILILDHPFFGSLAVRLGLVENNQVPTMITNGKDILYNSEFIDSLPTREIVGTLAHEVMHIALGHLWRRGSRQHGKWNTACDYPINENLMDAGFALPGEPLVDQKYFNLPAEEIYSLLPQEEEKKDGQGDDKKDDEQKGKGKGQGKGQGKGKDDKKNEKKDDMSDPGGCGGVMSISDTQENKEEKAEWKAAVNQALQISQGNLPANMKRRLKEILNPEVPWHILLRDFVERTARNDYDWTRPNRRYIGLNVILPSLISEQLPETIIAIDTSGSIDNEALSIFAAEASNVLGAYDTTIRIIYCDTKIQKEEIFTRADLPIKFNPKGGGGTNFCPVFDYIREKNLTPACLIYFTDLYGKFPSKEAEYPTMWLTTTKDKKAPFGMTVNFKKERTVPC